MARNPRNDFPGSWHHVMNRGIARRSLFETRDDIRFFVACMARAVRRGQLEVHAWCILTTHYHLLVRSPAGALSDAMRRIQNAYVRRFNRGRKRDGPLVRGRYRSKLVDSLEYRAMLVRYIDDNPVQAGLVQHPCEYPHGSARAYAYSSGPAWLSRAWVEDLVRARARAVSFDGAQYAQRIAGSCSPADRALVEWRSEASNRAACSDPLDQLLLSGSSHIQEWLIAKAGLADGTDPGLPVADPRSVRRTLAAERERLGEWELRSGRQTMNAWEALETGLLRDLTGAGFPEIAAGIGRSRPTAVLRCQRHWGWIQSDPDYCRVAADIARQVLAQE